MANIDSPDSIHAKMVELAPMHHRRGVTAAHLPVMGPLLIDVFAALGGPSGFTHEMRSAWAWFWEFLSRSMIQSPPTPLPPSHTKWTRRVPHPVLIGHAASLTPY
jgi:hemoglobin-like flavoprotein